MAGAFVTPGFAKPRSELPWLPYGESSRVIINAHNFVRYPSLQDAVAGYFAPRDTGSDVEDQFGSADGTLTNGATRSGNYYSFDGADDLVDITAASNINQIFASGGTIAAWINLSGWGELGFGRVLDKSDATATGQGGWSLFISDTDDQIRFAKGFATTRGLWVSPVNSIVLSIPQHIAITYNAASTSNDPIIYINGVAVTVTETSTPVGASANDSAIKMRIGSEATLQRSYQGLITDVLAYKRILAAGEIANLASQLGAVYA